MQLIINMIQKRQLRNILTNTNILFIFVIHRYLDTQL